MSSGPAPGLDSYRSYSTDKIDHLLSVPAPAPTTLQLDRTSAPAPEEPRYSYDIKASSVNVGTANPQWQPLHLRTPFILANVALLLFCALLVEILYFMNVYVHGMVPSNFVKTHANFVPYLTVLPGKLTLIIMTEPRASEPMTTILTPFLRFLIHRYLGLAHRLPMVRNRSPCQSCPGVWDFFCP